MGRNGCPQYGLEESEDSLQGRVDWEDRQPPTLQLTLDTGLSRGIQQEALTSIVPQDSAIGSRTRITMITLEIAKKSSV